MPGMTSGLSVTNRILVAAFRSALLHQGLIALLILATLAVAWATVREWMPGLAAAASRESAPAEHPARSLLRIGFGILWLFDGILQAQPAMPAGLPSGVIAPIAAPSPAWVRHVVNWAGTSWSFHPIQAAAATVWIQVGIGIWLIASRRGWSSRLAGLVSAGWGLVVWVFGEAFGGVFAPGLTWLFGAPGAALFYVAAGLLVALPARAWRVATFGRWLPRGAGLFFAGVALLQAWPGRGFWRGSVSGHPGTLTGMIQSMSGTPQPTMLSQWIRAFASFEAGNAFAVNLAVVLALGLIGACFLSARPAWARAGLVLLAVVGLADWVLVEDLGFLGGLGTDPNSMIPCLLLTAGAYQACARMAASPANSPALAAPLGATATTAAAAAQPVAAIPAASGAAADTGSGLSSETAAAGVATAVTRLATAVTRAMAPERATPVMAAANGGHAARTSPQPDAAVGNGGHERAAAPPAPGAPQRPGPPAASEPASAGPGSAGPRPPESPPDPSTPSPATSRWRGRFPARRLAAGFAAAGLPGIVAAWAVAVILLGTAPMAAAQLNTVADPIIAQAIAGSAAAVDIPAPPFRLTDQNGRPVSLASLRGRVVLLTFLDPVCTTDCPILAQEFRAADQMLGTSARRVELVAVVANPIYNSSPYLQAFDRQEGLAALPNWKYLTGPLSQLQRIWTRYGVTVQAVTAGGMILHNDIAYVIDASGRIRVELNMDTGPGTTSSRSSFAGVLAREAQRAMATGK